MSFKIGQRVKLHPASDWFARGASYATCSSIIKGVARFKLQNIKPDKLRVRLTDKDVLPTNPTLTEEYEAYKKGDY